MISCAYFIYYRNRSLDAPAYPVWGQLDVQRVFPGVYGRPLPRHHLAAYVTRQNRIRGQWSDSVHGSFGAHICRAEFEHT